MSSVSRRVTALLPLGLLALASVGPLGISTAAFTSVSSNPGGVITAAADWTPPAVALAAAEVLRGTVTIPATATDGETGVKQVAISRSPEAAATWTALCTTTTAPYGCTFDTLTVADGYYDLHAVATDNAGYSATALQEGVLVDNTGPSASLGPVANTLNGVVTLTSTVSDAGSGVAGVAYQVQAAGSTVWTTACTATASPWSCRFDTTTVGDGTYSFRAVVNDVAGNSTTTSAVGNKRIDNTQSSVSMIPPPLYLRGTETISASAFSSAGIATVTLEYQRVGEATWTALCTTTAPPFSCAWNTTTVPDGDYNLRATMLDGARRTTVSATVTSRVDNTLTRGYDVQAANGGVSLGRLESGDSLTVTYSRSMNLGTILGGWTGGPQAVTVRVRDGAVLGLSGTDDTLDVLVGNTSVQLGSVNLRGDFVKAGRTATFAATMTAQTVTVGGVPATAVTISLGSTQTNRNLRTSSATPTMVWTPSTAALDISGAATSGAAVSELGPADRDM